MTQVEFLLDQRAYCTQWMATPASQLPGTLTHDKLAALSIETELQLIEHETYDAYGRLTYR